ncbi:MAG: transposase [Chlorobiales bacterium]|nr:transposase [Chlorobiales bacterium]
MPRGPRLDTPGTLHHVMVRGIEQHHIVNDDTDRQSFISRLGKTAAATETTIYAWALMTNHAHLLLKSGKTGLSDFMRKFLTGYATQFNLRHHRHGHLFQNRYKSIVCEEEPYFLKLVSYIHLNPLRAGLVGSLEELERYAWCGHSVILKHTVHDWQDRTYVLQHFGEKESSALRSYLEFVREQSAFGAQPELTGGGLVRSAGGWSEVLSMRQRGEPQFSDERILGSGDFVKQIVDEADESIKERLPSGTGLSIAMDILERKCQETGISLVAVRSGSRRHECTNLRSELARQFVIELGLSYADAARVLGISASAVNQIFRRAR